MKQIIFPLEPRMRGADVGNLQAALQLLLDRVAILPRDDGARLELAELLERERARATYGPATQKVVDVFQAERGLGVNGDQGSVDEVTADALNALLREWGMLDGENGRRGRVVSGQVRREDGLPLAAVTVRVFQDTRPRAVRLGEDVTDGDGGYTVRYDLLGALDRTGVRITAVDGGTALASTTIERPQPFEVVDLTVPPAEDSPPQQRLDGRVLFEDGRPAENLELRLYRLEFGGGATLLAQDRTLAGGGYAFSFDAEAVPGPLELRVSADGEEVALSEPVDHLDGQAAVTLNVVAPASLAPLGSEYGRLAADLEPLVGGLDGLAAAKETTEQPDLTLLNRETGWDARLISLAATSQRLSADPDMTLPPEVVYGLLRAGLPSDKLQLAQVGTEAAQQALDTVHEAGIVDVSDVDRRRFKARFEAFASAVQLAVPAPGTQATYGDLLDTSGLDDEAKATFASVYLGHRGDAAELWASAAKAGLTDTQIVKLQRHGKLAFLAGNSAAVTERLSTSLGDGDPGALVEHGLYGAGAWVSEINAAAGIAPDRFDGLTSGERGQLEAVIPSRYAGDSAEERREAFAEDMARKVRMTYPTQVVAHMVKTDEGGLGLPGDGDPATTATLLESCAGQGFRLGETPIEPFLAVHTGVRGDLGDDEFDAARAQMKTLQRVYQITPTNEAMAALLRLGLTSAYDVVAIPEAEFIERYTPELGSVDLLRLVYRKATQVTSLTYNIFAIGKKVDAATPLPPVTGTAAGHAAAKGALKETLKQYPTMESLFGSMDSCDCEHCGSVLSPAAYFVDLLQFLDVEPHVWAGFLDHFKRKHGPYPHPTPYEVLVERRPDLAHLSLSCDNVETALPYIDVVNEILEFYVANRTLTAAAVHDTGEATTADLLAEPQHVIEKAYDELAAARYPTTLPFDLPVETARRFCEYFDRPLAHVLEVFRQGDELFAPTRDYDRAAVFAESLGISPAESAIFTDAAPLADDRWHELYGFWRHRPAIANPTNAGNATVALANAGAEPVKAGDVCTYFDVSANGLRQEQKAVSEVGDPDSAGPGRTLVTFTGVWDVPPEANDLLVFAAPGALGSAKTLANRLGVRYRELVDVVQTGFVNPKLDALVLLHKLGVGIHNLVFCRAPANTALYAQNKDLLGKDPSTMSAADKARFNALSEAQKVTLREVDAFERRLAEFSTESGVSAAQIEAALAAVPLDEILVLADPDAGCDFDLTTVRYASGRAVDAIALLRINLFVRLWRKLGWSIEEVDRALQAFVPKNASFDSANLAKRPLAAALVYIAHLKALHDRAKGSRLSLLTLWSEIATTGRLPLYASLFLTPGVRRSDDAFDHPLGDYLAPAALAAMAQARTHSVLLRGVAPADEIDPAAFAGEPRLGLSYDAARQVQHLTYKGVLSNADKAALAALSPSPALPKLLDAVQAKAADFSRIKGHMPALQGALGLTADEIALILADAGLTLDGAALSLPNVSLLHRYRVLASAMKRSVRDVIALKQLSGLDPFAALTADPPATIEEDRPFSQTLRFVEVAQQLADSGLTIEDLDFVLRDRTDETGQYRPDPAGRLALLRTLAEGVRAIRAAHAVPADPGALSDETLRQELGLLLAPDVVERFVSMLNGTVETTVSESGVAKADALDPAAFSGEAAIRDVSYDETRQVQRLTFRGVLFDAQKAALLARLPRPAKGAPHVHSDVLEALLDAVQPIARTFFEQHLQKQPAGVQPGGGFLDAADFALLFGPAPAGATDAQLQDRLRQQRTRLAEAFFPFLQRRLVHQLVVQTLVAHTQGDPALTESLLVDPALLAHEGAPLLDVLAGSAARGVTATFYDGAGGLLSTTTLADVDTAGPAKPAGTDAARFEGYLELPAAGAYRFRVALTRKDATAKLRFDHLPQPTLDGIATADGDEVGDGPSEYVELAAGVLYRYTLEVGDLAGGDARMLVQGETLPRDRVAQLPLSPLAAIADADAAVAVLTKTLTLLDRLGLGEGEARYVLTHLADFDGVSLDTLARRESVPAFEAKRITALFRFVLRLTGYALLKRDLGAGGTDLVEVFAAARAGDDAAAFARLAKLTRRDEETVRSVAHALAPAPSLVSERPLRRLRDALDVVQQFGVPVEHVAGWGRIVSPGATPAERQAVARDLKEAIKSRFEPPAWQRVAQPIYDGLRARQRDALVAHVMHQRGFRSIEQLYEYFLIDPGMEPVVRTSRLRLAISSVQLFIQRCLLNLERRVLPAAIVNADQWEWMRRYRVWEANRKIFLFPENWLEPEFRHDKTALYDELEGALLKDDVSSELVEDAFLGYLRRLEELARLNVVAMHLETKANSANNVLHVIARTYSAPYKHFYRRLEHSVWSAWEPITTEIQGDHLAPVIWRDRLHLFWLTFLEKAGKPATGGADPTVSELKLSQIAGLEPGRKIEVQLHWSEYLNGEWTTQESGGLPVPIDAAIPAGFTPESAFVHVSLEKGGDGVYVHMGDPIGKAFFLARRNSTPQLVDVGAKPRNLYSANTARATRYEGSNALQVTFTALTVTGEANSQTTRQILKRGRSFSLVPCNHDIALSTRSGLEEIAALMKPVFYQDSANTFYVEPTAGERTIEEWQEWVKTPAKEGGDEREKPDWWKEIVVIPQIPKKRLPDPLGPVEDVVINPKAQHVLKRSSDWLVNPGTVVRFGGELVGAKGQAGVEIVTAGEVASGVVLIDVHPGSGLAGDEAVVRTAGSFELDGGLNIVGGGGFNAGLAQNFKTFGH